MDPVSAVKRIVASVPSGGYPDYSSNYVSGVIPQASPGGLQPWVNRSRFSPQSAQKAWSNYFGVANQVFPNARPPRLVFTNQSDPGELGFYAPANPPSYPMNGRFVTAPGDSITLPLSGGVPSRLVSGGKLPDESLLVLAHELAHAHQNKATQSSWQTAEGAAQVFALNQLLRLLGRRVRDTSDYATQEQDYVTAHGGGTVRNPLPQALHWIFNGQFKK